MRRIDWQHRLARGTPFRIEASRDDGATWSTVGSMRAQASRARFWWTVAGPATARLRFRVSADGSMRAADLNDAPITVDVAALSLEGLNTLHWGLGSTQTIRWAHNLGARVGVAIDLSRDGGATWEPLEARVDTSGTETTAWKWTVTGPATQRGVLRIKSLDGIAAGELHSIVIAPPFIQLAPVRPATPWHACEPRRLRWTSNLGRSDVVQLQMSGDGQHWTTQGESSSGAVDYWPPEHIPNLHLRVVWKANQSIQSAIGPIPIINTPVPNWCDDGQ
jgi:hypothetical protein